MHENRSDLVFLRIWNPVSLITQRAGGPRTVEDGGGRLDFGLVHRAVEADTIASDKSF